jgi:IS5 family transposase
LAQLFQENDVLVSRQSAQYGRPSFDPLVLLKMLLVAYLYNLSERQVETYINDSMSAKYFLGLGMDQSAPDHSTLPFV